MNIGVNCYHLSASIGGLKQYFHTLFRELLTHDTSNEYVFFHFARNAGELNRLGIDRWKHRGVLLNDQMEVRNHLKKIDLYFCPFGAIWPVPLPLPCVVTVVDLQEKYYPQFFTEQDHWNRDRHFYGSTNQADRVVTISEFSRDSICEHHRVHPSKVDVVHLCPQNRFAEALVQPSPPTRSLPDRFVFYPANHWHHKNHDCLLHGLRILREQYSLDLPVVFTGFRQDNGYAVEAKAREYGVRATFFECVSVEELAYLYKAAALLCFPSLFEGFGIPLVEAMMAGCPVACADRSSLPEIAGDAALLFDPDIPAECARAMFTLFKDEQVRQRLIAKGIERARNFTPQKLAAGHRATFHQAASEYSSLRFVRNKYLFNPLHELRMAARKSQAVRRVGLDRNLTRVNSPSE
jgi:glycosyltransferase involved in cell wall biosynthesis